LASKQGTIKCPSCGLEIHRGNYCSECGKELPAELSTEVLSFRVDRSTKAYWKGLVKEFDLDRRQGKAILAAACLLRRQFESGKHLEDILGSIH
jgi:hypothetical protein